MHCYFIYSVRKSTENYNMAIYFMINTDFRFYKVKRYVYINETLYYWSIT